MGFVGIGYHSHLLEGVEDIVFEHSIYIPFIEGRGIIFMLRIIGSVVMERYGAVNVLGVCHVSLLKVRGWFG